MVPLALIFNELFSNSFKYAFNHKSTGKIEILGKLNKSTSKTEFTYRDNGQWIESSNSNSFGLELIDTLTEQLEGMIKREIKNGTHYYLEFKNLD